MRRELSAGLARGAARLTGDSDALYLRRVVTDGPYVCQCSIKCKEKQVDDGRDGKVSL